ncbi:unnamed protein product [Mortierella alpina]
MLQLKSILNVIDNSGAVWAECIRVLHGGKYARIGDEIVVVVNKAKSNAVASASGIAKVKKGDVRHAPWSVQGKKPCVQTVAMSASTIMPVCCSTSKENLSEPVSWASSLESLGKRGG